MDKKININIIQAGDDIGVDIIKLCSRLNSLQKSIIFTPGSFYLLIDEIPCSLRPPFYSGEAICKALQDCVNQKAENEKFIAITNVRIGIEDDLKNDNIPDGAIDYFALWGQTLTGCKNVGVISLAIWRMRYERNCFRTDEQFIAYNVVSFIGDEFFEPKLSHFEFRWCAFDFNDDLDSLADSIKRSRICRKCAHIIKDKLFNSTKAKFTPSLEDLNALLTHVRRPTFVKIIEFLSTQPLFQITLFGALLSIILSALYENISTVRFGGVAVALICIIIIAGAILWQRIRPSRPLG